MFGFMKSAVAASLSMDEPLAPGRKVAIAVRDGRAILMDLNSGRYFGLDDVGSRIWQMIIERSTPTEIIAVIEAEYAGPQERLRDDAERFMTTLLELRLVHQ